MKHRTLYASLLFVFIMGVIIFLLVWTNPIEMRNFEFEGKGTRLLPYKINSVEDLEKFRDLVNEGESFSNTYFMQNKDLDLAGIENWTPIGVYGGNRYFYGIYDGAGHTICNLTSISDGNTGLFGVLGGEVRNLGIESGYIEGAYIGSIASHGISSSSIINCYNKATLHGTGRAGGIADNLDGGIIKYCWNLGEVSADSGVNYGISSYSAIIEGCYCISLPPAPKTECEVNDTITFTLEELEDINNERELRKDDRDFRLIKTGSQTVSFVQEDRYSKFVKWLKEYWLLLSLMVCSAIFFCMVCCICRGKRKHANDVEKIVPAYDTYSYYTEENFLNRKRFLYVTFFLIVCIYGMILINKTLAYKREGGIISMQGYYKQPKESVDVLFLGSSRAGFNLDLETLWKYYGISGYACWGSHQPFWNTYYFLKEAINVSRPKIVVLEVGAATWSFEYSDDGRQYANTYGLNGLLNRIQAVQVSSPQKRWSDLILGFPIYHSRFNELTQNDFAYYPWHTDSVNYKGNSVRYGSGEYDLEDASEITEIEKIPSKEERYLRKIIEHCKKEGIPITLFASPYPSRVSDQPYYNAVQEIANEYSISFINFNLLDAETGFEAEDFFHDGHINTNGGRKISTYLGQYIMSNYMILDHRGDKNYMSWDVFANNMENDYLRQITEADDYFAELARDGRTVVVMKRDVPEDSEAYNFFLQKIMNSGFDLSFLAEEEKACYIVNMVEKRRYNWTQESSLSIDGMNIVIDLAYTDTVSIDGDKIYTLPESGVICMVYDSFTEEIVDIVVFSEDTKYMAEHQ